MKLFSLVTLATTATALYTQRMTRIAGVEVIDTQIVRDARAMIKEFPDYLYSHQMRSWLFGAAMINANETLRRHVDLEVHAIATMLHDLGWDMTPGSRWVSSDKRFEVDGAIGARKWLSEHPIGKFLASQALYASEILNNQPEVGNSSLLVSQWAPERVRKVFQAIALHGSGSIVDFFELEEAVIVQSIGQDYHGPVNGVSQESYNAIAKAFPQDELLSGTNKTFTWLAQTKPATTWGKISRDFFPLSALNWQGLTSIHPKDTWLEPWGEAFVPGYSAVGHRSFDNIVGTTR
ncbi:hypothetical protein GQX73_g1898 [Xylaria multiplex]|uniref:HD domain-containing protein n=1 Tax=Xylaria multiplex TaxID=323545 RepID=A0A7C8N2R2_9PEZI|nr:hypothetical protein GQX73_g1898 [Xylaria multiplex]